MAPAGCDLPEPGRELEEFGAGSDAGGVEGKIVNETLLPTILGILIEAIVADVGVTELDSLCLEG